MKKKQEKTEEVPETTEVVEEAKFLSSEELMKIELYHSEEKARKAVEENFALKTQIVELTKKHLESEIVINGKDAHILKLGILKTTEAHNVKRREHKTVIDEIKSRYDLKGKWGFDPSTGEIKED